MLSQPVIHPPLLSALAAAGHGALILIADGNYPVSTAIGPNASTIHLNMRAGLIDALTALELVRSIVPLEAAAVMSPGATEPEIFAAFRDGLKGIPFESLTRAEFYAAARGGDTAVVIATGETRHFGNLLLTVGVIGERGRLA